jgi:hypothetical protein
VRKLWKLAAVTGVAVAVGTVTSIGSAYATPPAGYGFDGQPHAVVGGGSDTTYKAQLGLTELYMSSSIGGCEHITAVGANLNKCNVLATAETDTNLGNYQGDTFAQANPTGSSAGVASLNGAPNSATTDAGTLHPVNYTCPSSAVVTTTGPNVDYARSSRAPKTSAGNSVCTANELDTDTFWGYGQDGIQVFAFDATRGAELQAQASPSLTPNQLFNIWNCSGGTGTAGRMRWSDVIPSLVGTPRGNVDMVPWGLNASAGTFASFQSYITNNASGVPVGWSPNGQVCDRKLASGLFPLENDMKPMLNDPVTLSTDPSSADNPDNWIAWGSFGVMSAFNYLSAYTRQAQSFQAVASPINGILPSSARIIANTYPIGRTIYHVTLKRDADCAKTAGACNFGANPGPVIPATGGTDLNVAGGTGGVSGAIREFTRFLCRGTAAQHGFNPYSGINNFSEITTRINNAGFTVVPSALRTSGSRCQVLS